MLERGTVQFRGVTVCATRPALAATLDVAKDATMTSRPSRTTRWGMVKLADTSKDPRNGLISRAAVADFLVALIDDDTKIGKTRVRAYWPKPRI